MNYISTNMHPDHKCITDSLWRAAYREYLWRRKKVSKHLSIIAKIMTAIHTRDHLDAVLGHPISFFRNPNQH